MTEAPAGPTRPFFVLGCPRSGTTLMREILDSHSRLAVVDESHLILGLAPRWWSGGSPSTLEDVLAHPRPARWDVDLDQLRAVVQEPREQSFPALIDAVLRGYAACKGAHRWGDKTPGYVSYIGTLARWFPDAQFVHMVRDGREVAASLAERPWGPPTAVSGAFWWAHKVRTGRRQGGALGADRYLEVRLEDLVEEPERMIERVCTFLGERFEPGMLEYHRRYAQRHPQPRDQERHLVLPPTTGLRTWRSGMSSRTADAVETVCSRQLRALGYSAGRPTLSGAGLALAVRARDLIVTGPRSLLVRLRPRLREF